jgi:hypothetical protein
MKTLIAFELEGCWKETFGWELKEDGSLYCRDACSSDSPCMLGEYTSPIFDSLQGLKEDLVRIKDFWLGPCSRAGVHFHLSFPSISDYISVFCFSFYSRFIDKMSSFQEFTNRMSRNESYALPLRKEDFRSWLSDRYRVINFGPSYRKHGTFEFRAWDAPEDIMKLYDWAVKLSQVVAKQLDRSPKPIERRCFMGEQILIAKCWRENSSYYLYLKLHPKLEELFSNKIMRTSAKYFVENGERKAAEFYEQFPRLFDFERITGLVFSNYGSGLPQNHSIVRTVGISKGKTFPITDLIAYEEIESWLKDLKQALGLLWKTYISPSKNRRITMRVEIEETI